MAHQRDLSHDTLASDPFQGRSYTLARLLSQIFHPILLSIANFLILGHYAVDDDTTGLKWAALGILTQVLPPTLFYTWRLRQGAYSDEDISLRHQRHELYIFGIVSLLVTTLLLAVLGAPRPFLALMLSTLAIGLAGGLVNLFWKISVHSAAIASTAMITLLYSYTLGITLWLCALAVGWARVRTRNHTPMQVLAGFGTAATIVVVVFQIVRVI
jgi:membrane-associated phospholipid phosphatase